MLHIFIIKLFTFHKYEFLYCYRWVPESARWLIANGRVDKAHYYLHKCAVMNRKKDIIDSIKPEVRESL